MVPDPVIQVLVGICVASVLAGSGFLVKCIRQLTAHSEKLRELARREEDVTDVLTETRESLLKIVQAVDSLRDTVHDLRDNVVTREVMVAKLETVDAKIEAIGTIVRRIENGKGRDK